MSPATYQRDVHAAMERMWLAMHREPPTGDADIDFLVMMIPHHLGAVEMARLALGVARDPLVRTLAEAIIAAQMGEIIGMQGRLAALRSGGGAELGYPSPSGNVGPERPRTRAADPA